MNMNKTLREKLSVILQHCLPKQALSLFAGKIADIRIPFIKNKLIQYFLDQYPVNMNEAAITSPLAYPSFNEFFIRKLKPELRPIDSDPKHLISPVDGTIAEMGFIQNNQLLQAKNSYFDLKNLLGNDDSFSTHFHDGAFTTLYLAPHNYHRVHMPLAGTLKKTIFVPGKLFSVNEMASAHIPKLYARNERLICYFETELGWMAVILVGAMLVGSIQPVWSTTPVREKKLTVTTFDHPLSFKKGDELGYFKMGSTVILLFEKNKIKWLEKLHAKSPIQFGEYIGDLMIMKNIPKDVCYPTTKI